MAKLLTINQGDYGIIINAQLYSEDKQPIHLLEEDEVICHVQYPSGECKDIEPEDFTVLDKLKGIVRINISEVYTTEEGYYQLFIGIKSPSYKINAQKPIPYYVTANHQIGEH